MKHLQLVGLAALAATALSGLMTGSASATTLEVGGVVKNSSVFITATLKRSTGGLFANTCLTSHFAATTTSPFTGTKVTAPISSLSFTNCTEEPVVVEKLGALYIERIANTTNGTAFLEETIVKEPSPFGSITCNFGSGTDIGVLTGVNANHAILDVNAVVNCGIIPSAIWEATYVITSPTGLGVVN